MAVPVSELQKQNPSAIIELFILELSSVIHGASTVYRFHAGASQNANGSIVFAGQAYTKMPIEAEGFEYNGKQLPRPKLRISNILGTITTLLLTLPMGLEGAKVTRRRTLLRYLDAVNFSGGTVVPIPTLPADVIRTFSVDDFLKIILPWVPCISVPVDKLSENNII